MVKKIDLTGNADWIAQQKFKRIGDYENISEFTKGWSDNHKNLFFAALAAQGSDAPNVKVDELVVLAEAMILSDDLPKNVRTINKFAYKMRKLI